MKNIFLFFLLFFLMEVSGVFGETDETVPVKEGDSVTLHTGFTVIQSNDVIDWSFGKNRDRIARLSRNKNAITIYDVLDGTFRGRLKVGNQTGDLTIRNIKTTDNGIYEVASKYTQNHKFSVTVQPYEVGESQSVSVLLGDSVTLHTDATDMQKYELIQWRFEQDFIANISRRLGNVSTSDGERFRHRLQLEFLTGSLTINHIGTSHSGLYEVDIRSSSKHTIHKTFNVTVSGEMRTLSVMKADSVTLNTDTELQTYDVMLWMFASIFLAEIHKAIPLFYMYDGADERFRNRLKLDPQTGSLTITNITTKHAGLYELKISSSRHTVHKRISVTVNEIKSLSVMEGESVTLLSETEIQRDDLIIWKSGDTQIAEIKITDQRFPTYDVPDGRFRGRLQLDHQTGSLTIMNTRTTDSGLYELKISSSRRTVHKRISVTVSVPGLSSGAKAVIVIAVLLLVAAGAVGMIYYRRKISALERKKMEAITVTEGGSVRLLTDVTEIQREDVIKWMFRDEYNPIAEIKEWTREFYNGADGRFRNRLELDHQTGSLTITDTKTTDSGVYKLVIERSGKEVSKKSKKFSVTVSVEAISVTEGDRVILQTKADIKKDDQMLLLFGEQELCIGQIKGGTEEFSPSDVPDDRFKGRLELNKKNRSVNIRETKTTDSGLYKLLITGSGTVTSKIFSLTVSDELRRNRAEGTPLMGVDVSNSRL